MADPPAGPAPKVLLVFQDAYQRFKDVVTREDASSFVRFSLDDVKAALRDLERRQSESRSLRNLNRIMPFLDGLERYSKVVDILCNGTPFLPWIWAPVKLVLELTSGFPAHFNQLIEAYKKIGNSLPRFDRLANKFRNDPDVQNALAIFYADVLEFHRRVYILVKKRGWSYFFKSSWTRFEARFKGILDDIATHADLVDREVASTTFVEARELREAWLERTETQEKDRTSSQTRDVFAWLNVLKSEYEQEEELYNLSSRCHEHSCDWIFKNPKVLTWKQQGPTNGVIWLKGKPGSGKSVLCSNIVNTMREDEDRLVLYYICNQASVETQCDVILKSIAAQILRKHRDLALLIYDDYISKSLLPTLANMRKVLQALMSAIPSTRIVLDGLDELKPAVFNSVLKEVTSFTRKSSTTKVLFSSRDVDKISKELANRATISLNDEQKSISGAIQGFVRSKVEQLRESRGDISMEEDSMIRVEKALIEKADGMFLWVYLVVDTLEMAYSIADMLEAVESLPKGLDEVYDRIFAKIMNQLDDRSKDKATRILEWVAFGHRPLKNFEIQHGIALRLENTCLNDETKQSKEVFNLCKPLLEEAPNSTIRFVHSSVKEYLLKHRSPFTDMITPQFDITFACLSYLVSGFSLMDPSFPEEQRRLEVAKGFHGLQLYANHYWIDHLHAYMQACRNAPDLFSAQPLLSQLTLLEKKFRRLAENMGNNDDPDGLDQKFQIDLRGLVHLLKSGRDIHEVATTVGKMRLGIQVARERAAQPMDAGTDQPIMVFSHMLQRYNEIAQHLLCVDSIDGLNTTSLSKFKSVYGASAITCRFRDCPRATHGFADAAERAKHESEHILKYTCTDISCEYSKLGFSSARALKQHLTTYHPDPEAPSRKLPQSILMQVADGGRSSSEESVVEELPEAPDGFEFPPEHVAIPQKYTKRPRQEEDDGFALSTTNWDDC